MARNDVYLNINALSPADAVVTGQQDMTAATVPELVLGDTPTFNFYFTDNTNVWPSWAGNASYTLTWALSDAVAGDFAPAATTGNATPITGGWSVILPLNSYDLVGLLNTKRVGQPYPVQNLWQQLRVTDPSGNEVTRAMFWTPVRYRAISDTQNTESASPTGGRFVTVNNVNTLTTPTAAQFYAANPVPTSALGTAANGELLIGNGTGFTKATLTAGSGVSITNGSGSITITATDGDITLDDGTAAAPSLKFTADTDTGLFRPSDNVVGISAGGVSRATFGATSAINGTTIPGSKTLVVTTDKLSALAATTSAELAGVISDETGSGALVFATSPTLTTPILGTPQSGTLSSCTGLPISTGVSGLGTNVATFLATPSSANLASAVTDETGTGALVFANTPTLVTPVIGAATGTSLTVTGNVTASDAILGTSGPSVKSSLSARAPRQGLVFDGTQVAGTTSVPAFGTAAFTASAIISPTFTSNGTYIFGGASGAFDLFVDSSGVLNAGKVGVGAISSGTTLTAGKYVLVTYVRTSTSASGAAFYVNGVQVATVTDANDYTTAITLIGNAVTSTSAYQFVGGLEQPILYNRALSASEVVALYEAGAPAGADYNSASNTALNTNTVTDAGSGSLSGTSATGFTATATGVYYVRTAPVFSIIKGAKYRVSFTASSVTGTWNSYISLFNTAIDSPLYAVASGANSFEMVANVTRTTNEVIEFASSGAGTLTVSGLSVTRIGLLLAPDAAQAGGGLVWYDTSGNAANITLPASGVSWNVPTSGYWGGNLTVSGTSTIANGTAAAPSLVFAGSTTTGLYRYGANVVGLAMNGLHGFAFNGAGEMYGPGVNGYVSLPSAGGVSLTAGGTNQNITLTPSGTGLVRVTCSRATAYSSSLTGDVVIYNPDQTDNGYSSLAFGTRTSAGGVVDTGSAIASITTNHVGASFATQLAFLTRNGSGTLVEAGRFTNGGNLLIGTTTDDGLGKLQVNGSITAYTGAKAVSGSSLFVLRSTDASALSGGLTLYTNATGSSRYLKLEAFEQGFGGRSLVLQENGGSVLIATNVDSGNGKLQLATHSSSAGGIGFGTDISAFRATNSILSFVGGQTSFQINLAGSASTAVFGTNATGGFINSAGSTSLVLQTNTTTALTLDSSQNATFAGRIGLTASGTSTIYSNFIPAATGTYAGSITMQAGGGSAGYGGGLVLFGHSHATRPGWVIAGISGGSGGRFCVNSSGLGAGTDLFTVSDSGNMFIVNSTSVPSTNPSGGGFLYVESGALKYRGSSGTVTTIANA